MKQINECLDRAFSRKNPLKKKWKAFLVWRNNYKEELLLLYHYHHLVLVYSPKNCEILYEWYEKPTDLRGLNAAKKYLNKMQEVKA